MFATAERIDSNGVTAASAVLTACLRLSAASDSTETPTVAGAELVTDCHPRITVEMMLMAPAAAVTAPGVWHVAVTLIVPPTGITTEAGRFQSNPFTSCTTPLVIVV